LKNIKVHSDEKRGRHMSNIDLVDFIEQELVNEANEDSVRSFLEEQGYSYKEIDEAFRSIDLSRKRTRKLLKIKKPKDEELDNKFFAFLIIVITVAAVTFIYTIIHILVSID
jgi:hypothetical protein